MFILMFGLIPLCTKYASTVKDKIFTGTECKEIKSSTSDKEGDQVDGKSTVLSTTPGTD